MQRFLLDETGCSGKFLRHFYDYTMKLQTDIVVY